MSQARTNILNINSVSDTSVYGIKLMVVISCTHRKHTRMSFTFLAWIHLIKVIFSAPTYIVAYILLFVYFLS